MSFSEEAGNDGEREQNQQPRVVRDQRAGECQQSQCVLRHRQQETEQRDASNGLTPCALEVIVKVRILELREIELGRVLHQLDAHFVGEQISKQALDQRRCSRQNLRAQYDQKLERE